MKPLVCWISAVISLVFGCSRGIASHDSICTCPAITIPENFSVLLSFKRIDGTIAKSSWQIRFNQDGSFCNPPKYITAITVWSTSGISEVFYTFENMNWQKHVTPFQDIEGEIVNIVNPVCIRRISIPTTCNMSPEQCDRITKAKDLLTTRKKCPVCSMHLQSVE
jgi:hypothetical protein